MKYTVRIPIVGSCTVVVDAPDGTAPSELARLARKEAECGTVSRSNAGLSFGSYVPTEHTFQIIPVAPEDGK